MFPEWEKEEAVTDSSQPTQAILDHTQCMNDWFIDSFRNLFRINLPPVIKELKRSELELINEMHSHVNRELAMLHVRTAVLARLALKEVDPDQFEARFNELIKALDLSVDYSWKSYSVADDDTSDDDQEGTKDDTRPSIFVVTGKTWIGPDDVIKTEQQQAEKLSWLKKLMGR